MSDKYEQSLGSSQIEKAEHIEVNGTPAKRVLLSGWDGSNINDVNVDSSGGLSLSGFSIPTYDEIVLSYTGDDLTGVVYKLGSVVQATLTLSYSLGNLTGIVKT